MANQKKYVDLDLDFIKHPLTGDVSLKYDDDAVKASLKNLILTNIYEKYFHPEISGNVTSLLFENYNPVIGIRLKNDIERIVNEYEPRARIINATVNPVPDRNLLEIGIIFQVLGSLTTSSLNIPLERLR